MSAVVIDAKHCNQCRRAMGSDWQWKTCSICQERDRQRAKEQKIKLNGTLAMYSTQVYGVPGSIFAPQSNIAGASRAPPLLSSRCVSCMSLLTKREARTDERPLCNGCRKSKAANPQLYKGAALRPGAPIADPTRHYPQHLRPCIPHYNSKGEIIKVSNSQPSARPWPPSHSPYVSFPVSNAPRMCWRYGCGAVLPPHIPGMTCEKCWKSGYTPYVPTNGSPLPTLPTPASSYSITRPDPSFAGVSSVSTGKGREVPYSGVSSMQKPRGPVSLPFKEFANDTITVTGLNETLNVVEPFQRNKFATSRALYSTKPLINKRRTEAPHIYSSISNSSRSVASGSGSVTKRSCETKGCENDIPFDTKWPRCTSCGLKRWKTRLQSNHNQSENSRRSKGSALPKKRKAGEMMGTAEGVGKQDTNLILGRDSDGIEFSSGDVAVYAEGEPGVDVDEKSFKSGFKIRIPAVNDHRSESTSTARPNPWTGPTRICVRRGCNTILPQSYRWKLCETCRTHAGEYQRRRLAIASSLACLSRAGEVNEAALLAPLPFQPAPPASLPPQANGLPPGYRNCEQCRNLVPEEYRYKSCQSCMDQVKLDTAWQRAYFAEKKGRNDGEFTGHSKDRRRGDGDVESVDRRSKKRRRERSMSCESEDGMYENGCVSPSDSRLPEVSEHTIPTDPPVVPSSPSAAAATELPSDVNTEESPQALCPTIENPVPAPDSSANPPSTTYETSSRPCLNPTCAFQIYCTSKAGFCHTCKGKGFGSVYTDSSEPHHVGEAGRGMQEVEEDVITQTKGRPRQGDEILHDNSFVVNSTSSTPSLALGSTVAAAPTPPSKEELPPSFTHMPLTNTRTHATTSNSNAPNGKFKSGTKSSPTPLTTSIKPHHIPTSTASYPSYQHLTPLVETFKARLDSFLVTFGWWARAKGLVAAGKEEASTSNKGTPNSSDNTTISARKPSGNGSGAGTHAKISPFVFGFEGEYSIISPRENVGGKRGTEETWRRVGRIVQEIERGSGLKFSSTSSFVIKTGGVLVRFECLHAVPVPAPPGDLPTSPSNRDGGPHIAPLEDSIGSNPSKEPSLSIPSPAPSTSIATSSQFMVRQINTKANKNMGKTKTMQGELEIAVMPDHSHRFFIGQRTIVRFRLVG